MMDLDLQ
jgi:hypothetical protein